MPDRDGAAVDVIFIRIDAKRVAAIEALARKRLVQFPKPNISDRQSGAIEELGNSKNRTYPHFVGRTPRRLKAAVDSEHLFPFGFGSCTVHQDLRGRTVGKLAGIACGHARARTSERATRPDCLQAP